MAAAATHTTIRSLIFTLLPGEQELLNEILVNPDDAARLVYADWLEEQGDERAAYLRIEVELHRVPNGMRRSRELREELRRIGRRINKGWIAAIARGPIESCRVGSSFCEQECPKQWERLRPENKGRVRQCQACGQSVHYCFTMQDVRRQYFGPHPIVIDASLECWDGELFFNRPLIRRTRESRRVQKYVDLLDEA